MKLDVHVKEAFIELVGDIFYIDKISDRKGYNRIFIKKNQK